MAGDDRADSVWDHRLRLVRKFGRAVLPYVGALVLLGVGGSLVYRVLFSSVEIGTPATESESVVRSGERVIQLVQWTISTILLIGGALIGINWYRDEERYKRDREELRGALNDLELFKAATEQRLWSLSRESIELAYAETMDAMTAASHIPDPTEMYRILRNGYERVRQLEPSDISRHRILLRRGLSMMDLTEGEVVIGSEAEEMASERFLTAIVQEFPDLRPIIDALRGRLTY